MRKWINRDDGKLCVVGNYTLNIFEIIGYLVFIVGGLVLNVKVLAELKPYGWLLFISGLILLVYGGKKNNHQCP